MHSACPLGGLAQETLSKFRSIYEVYLLTPEPLSAALVLLLTSQFFLVVTLDEAFSCISTYVGEYTDFVVIPQYQYFDTN